MSKQEDLEKISKEISRLKRNFPLAIESVPGEGSPDAKLMILGEAPGQNENKTGRPFIGRAGKLLEKVLGEVGMRREDVFITSIVKHYPGMRAPNPAEIALSLPLTRKQIEVIQPKIILLLGNVALKAMLGKSFSITKERGKIIANETGTYFATFHPAAALRFQKFLPDIRADMKKLSKIVSEM
jgi:DNA polymerase